MCGERQTCKDNRFSRSEEPFGFYLYSWSPLCCLVSETNDAATLLWSAAKAWECPYSPAELSGIWRWGRGTKSVEWTQPQVCVPMVFIGSYSIVGRQGMGRECVAMLLVAELPERENRGVFWGFLFCGWFGWGLDFLYFGLGFLIFLLFFFLI